MERSWRGGQRLFVNLLVENNQLCKLYPLKRNSCDDMDSVRLQAKQMREFEDYIDAQYGGPGAGWYRIVTNPFEARKVINQGKLAVVMGIETSMPFDCTFNVDPRRRQPACDSDAIDASSPRCTSWACARWSWSTSSTTPSPASPATAATIGVAGQQRQLPRDQLATGTCEHREPEDPGAHDHNQTPPPEIDAEQQDALFGAIAQVFGPQRAAAALPAGRTTATGAG